MSKAIKWLLEIGVFLDGNPERLAEIVRARGMECKIIRYAKGDEVRAFNDGDRVIVYGSMGFVRDLVRATRWQPTAWFDEVVLSCHHYYPLFKRHLLQKNVRFLALEQVRQQVDALYREVGVGGHIFIRPDDNLKSFAGSVVPRERFERWLNQNISCYDLPAALLCVVSSPQQILGEWRLVVAHKQVLTASAYLAEDRSASVLAVPEQVLAKAGEILADTDFDPFPLYVMDIAQTVEGFSLMEIGSINCASLYACDLKKVVDAASGIAGQYDHMS